MMIDFSNLHPSEIRQLIRDKKITGPTAGMSKGYTQANLAILKKEYAFDFLLFCQRNQKQCPLIDVTEIGSYTSLVAKDADIHHAGIRLGTWLSLCHLSVGHRPHRRDLLLQMEEMVLVYTSANRPIRWAIFCGVYSCTCTA